MKGKIIPDFLANHGSQKQPHSRSQERKGGKSKNSQTRNTPLNISDGAKEQVVKSLTRISKDRICSNATGPVGRFKDDMGNDTVSRAEYSESNEDSYDSEQEINFPEMNSSEMHFSKMKPSETNLSKMKSSEINSLTKLLNDPSLTSAKRQNLCRKIAVEKGAEEFDRRRNEAAVLGQLH